MTKADYIEEMKAAANSLVDKYHTEYDEVERVRAEGKELAEKLKETFGDSPPTLKEFCQELDLDTDELDRDVQLEGVDFGMAVFSHWAGFPIRMNENPVNVACSNLNDIRVGEDMEPEEYVIVNDYYRRLLDE